ncbi:type VI secretion system-associated FHA domain protein TagH [Salmonella enterica subsp. enterica]|nr:type VI secretion system-associated FHA domain protein TagH [Salmonella enterica subsp. enterica]MIF51071.1 type VI secretion system-associated FHA domain protein TagH [Salmonella enterica subsp. enterica]
MQEQNQHQQTQPSLTLQVMNGNELESGRTAKCVFTPEGGDVGHVAQCYWSLQDRRQSVPERAFTVCWHDGVFCLKSNSTGLEINQAPVSQGASLVHLRQGDEIRLNSLILKAFVGNVVHYEKQMAAPETIVTNSDRLTDLLITEGQPEYTDATIYRETAPTVAGGFTQDPLAALQAESLTVSGNNHFLMGHESLLMTPPMSDIAEKGGLDSHFMDLPPVKNDTPETEPDMARRHVAVTPLMRGLDCTLPLHNSQDASDFLEEVGRAVQATLKGLLSLQHQQNSLSDKHLRPLEDNPLRLNMDYEMVLDVMFAGGKSPVHLSAPAAIAESLRNVRLHEEANRAAIVESLRVLLDAFSPQSLMRRFIQYRRSHELRQPLDDAGAWQMYSHYYDELASDRQQGFEMLFNEVYAQVYDRVLREKQREPEE